MEQLSEKVLLEKTYSELRGLNSKVDGVYQKLSDINNNIKAILDEIRGTRA